MTRTWHENRWKNCGKASRDASLQSRPRNDNDDADDAYDDHYQLQQRQKDADQVDESKESSLCIKYRGRCLTSIRANGSGAFCSYGGAECRLMAASI